MDGFPELDKSRVYQLATDTINSVGGGPCSAGAVVYLVKTTDSENSARELLSRLTTQEAIIRYLWQDLNHRPEVDKLLVWIMAGMMAACPSGPLPVMDIHNLLMRERPDIIAGVSVNHAGSLLKRDFAGLASAGGGRFGIPNEIHRLFPQETAAASIMSDSKLLAPFPRPEGPRIAVRYAELTRSALGILTAMLCMP
ncbi:hypothetical protein AAE478_009644 [Parahypoxylon ruwenzoriense]